MKINQLHFYLFMLCQTTASLTDARVTLGADVIITCDLDIEEIYWFKLKLPDPPVLILRTYKSTFEVGEYENSIFKHKYSVKTNSRLFIRNITSDELGVYYCVKTSEPQKFSSSTKIYITDAVQKNITDSVYRNQTESKDCQQHQTTWKALTITSVVLNVLLIMAVLGLLKSRFYANRRSKNTSDKPQITTTAQNSTELQYAEVYFSKRPRRNKPSQDQTTYSTVFYSQ